MANEEFPLLLNTGRIRDQWHTMRRSGKSPGLANHLPEPYVDLHPQDAMLCGVRQHELARASTSWGSLVARAKFSGEMRRGQVFVPIHWNGQTAFRPNRARFASILVSLAIRCWSTCSRWRTAARTSPAGIKSSSMPTAIYRAGGLDRNVARG